MIYKFIVAMVAVIVCMLFYDASYGIYGQYNTIKDQDIGYILFYFVFMYLPVYYTYQYKRLKIASMLLSVVIVCYIHFSIGDLFPYKHILIILCLFVGFVFIETLTRLKKRYELNAKIDIES